MEHIEDFKTQPYITGPLFVAGVIFLPIGLLILPVSVVAGVILLVSSILILTTHYRISVDLDNKTYHDYLWILGIKYGERGSFESIEYVFIKMNIQTQTMNSRVSSNTRSKAVYDAFLKLTPEEKIHLFTGDEKGKVMQRLKIVASRLHTKIVDYSADTPVETSFS